MAEGSATHPHDGGTLTERCPACGVCNEVQMASQGADDRPQSYHCAACREPMGEATASAPPRVTVVPASRCS